MKKVFIFLFLVSFLHAAWKLETQVDSWDQAKSYTEGEVVEYNGGVYVASQKTVHPAIAPTTIGWWIKTVFKVSGGGDEVASSSKGPETPTPKEKEKAAKAESVPVPINKNYKPISGLKEVSPLGMKKIMAYFVNYAIYDRKHTLQDDVARYIDNIDYLIYAFAIPDASQETLDFFRWSGSVKTDEEIEVFLNSHDLPARAGFNDPWGDFQKQFTATGDIKGNIGELIKLKKEHPSLKVILSVGGWTYRILFKRFAEEGKLDQLARSCVDILSHTTIDGKELTYDVFDGIDIDWEWAGGILTREEADAYVYLMEKLRQEIDKSGKDYLLLTALQAGPALYKGDTAIDFKRLHKVCNAINMMTYDFHGPWDKETGFNAPLDGKDASDVLCDTAAVDGFLKAGVPANKLLLGVPFYGRNYAGVPATNNGLYQTFSGPGPGKYEPGSVYYCDIKKEFLSNETTGKAGYNYYWSDTQKVPWLYNPAQKIFLSYDNPRSLVLKTKFAKDKGLAGIMYWETCGDTADGELVKIIRKELGK